MPRRPATISWAWRARGGVKRVVKGKSMTTEEIELNPCLEAAGIEAVETDLGEYIVQLRHEPPSHIITPAIHLSKEDIGHLFADKLGIEYTSDPPALTAVARERLREMFLSAEMGITGVNFAVAETGTLVVVENEGNGRFCSTSAGNLRRHNGDRKGHPQVRGPKPLPGNPRPHRHRSEPHRVHQLPARTARCRRTTTARARCTW